MENLEINQHMNDETASLQQEDAAFRILVCIDGSEESYRGLRYAVRLARGYDTDITLLYVRKVDKELSSEGLDMRISRENMLDWGIELPGMAALKQGLEILTELGYLEGEWSSEMTHIDNRGDPVGDNMVEYSNSSGRKVCLKIMVAPSAELGILEEAETGHYDITIVSETDMDDNDKGFSLSNSVSQTIATESETSVIVAKALEENKGHLVCLNGSVASLNMAREDAIMAARCDCPVYLYTVVKDESLLEVGQARIDEARMVIEEAGFSITGEKIGIGDKVENIIEEGKKHSLIVLSGEHKIGFRRFFKSSLVYRVLEGAHNSVMVRR
ncbi:MAG: universal stress protein [Gammaproteobacteria bacterium]